jgi:hypothetical protein
MDADGRWHCTCRCLVIGIDRRRKNDRRVGGGLVELGCQRNHRPESLADSTGEFAHANQPGRAVFFIVGNFGGEPTRNFNAPVGTPLLVSMLNITILSPEGGPDEATLDRRPSKLELGCFLILWRG